MARQVDENTYDLMVRISLDDAAKLFTLAGKRGASMSRCAGGAICRAVARVKPSDEALKWASERRVRNLQVRKRADEDTRNGRYRKGRD